MGFVGGGVGVRGEFSEKFLKICFVGENVYASQVECVVVEGDDSDQVTAWCSGSFSLSFSPFFFGVH
jgi:hypothetical protein